MPASSLSRSSSLTSSGSREYIPVPSKGPSERAALFELMQEHCPLVGHWHNKCFLCWEAGSPHYEAHAADVCERDEGYGCLGNDFMDFRQSLLFPKGTCCRCGALARVSAFAHLIGNFSQPARPLPFFIPGLGGIAIGLGPHTGFCISSRGPKGSRRSGRLSSSQTFSAPLNWLPGWGSLLGGWSWVSTFPCTLMSLCS